MRRPLGRISFLTRERLGLMDNAETQMTED